MGQFIINLIKLTYARGSHNISLETLGSQAALGLGASSHPRALCHAVALRFEIVCVAVAPKAEESRQSVNWRSLNSLLTRRI